MAHVLIRDGFDQDFCYPGDGCTPPVRGKYREGLPERYYEYVAQAAAGGKDKMRIIVELFTEHLRAWDIDDLDKPSQPARINAANIRLMPVPLQMWLVNVIFRWTPAQAEADLKNCAPASA